MFDSRIEHFLSTYGWKASKERLVVPLTGDASNRYYYRLIHGSRSVILVWSCSTDMKNFVKVAVLLKGLRFSVPEIYSMDTSLGVMLLEDFGDVSFSDLLDKNIMPWSQVYGLAMDVLIALQVRFITMKPCCAQLPRCTTKKFIDHVLLFSRVYPNFVLKSSLSDSVILAFERAWWQVVPFACTVPQGLVLWDYHMNNVMYLGSRRGIKVCGLLDFQDAGVGPVSYDLVSLIEDARRDVDEQDAQELVRVYLKAFPMINPYSFQCSLRILGALRHTRVIGVFLRLAYEQGRTEYLRYLPRVYSLLKRHLKYPELRPVRLWFANNIQSFLDDI